MRFKFVAIAGAWSLMASASLAAHHSFAAEYDAKKPTTMSGTVTKVEWTNPHAWIYLDIKDQKGKVTNWGFELGSPNLLVRSGWTSKSLKVGDNVTIEGSLAKDGSLRANARVVTIADGHRVFAGSSGGDTPLPSRSQER
jgi:Family of unknown function (DUF6152)